MVTIKQRFKKKWSVLNINVFVLIILLVIAVVAGTFLSNTKVVGSIFQKDLSGCTDVIAEKEFMVNKTNYWMDMAQKDAKDLWACQLELRRLVTKYNELVSDNTNITNSTS